MRGSLGHPCARAGQRSPRRPTRTGDPMRSTNPRRLAALAAAVVPVIAHLLVLAPATPAGALGEPRVICAFDGANTLHIELHTDQAEVTIGHAGTTFDVSGTDLASTDCGGATFAHTT